MTLKRVVDSLDDVPEALHEFYTERSGKFVLDADDATELKTALERERAAARKAAADLRRFEGVDLDRYNELLTAAEKAAGDDAKKAGDWDAREQQLIERHKAERAKIEARADKLMKSLEQAMVIGEATRAIAEAKGSTRLLLPHVRDRAKLIEDEANGFVVRVIDPATGREVVGDANGAPMSIEQLVNSFREDPQLGRAFEPSDASGSDSKGSRGAGTSGGKRVISRDEVAANLEDVVSGKVIVKS